MKSKGLLLRLCFPVHWGGPDNEAEHDSMSEVMNNRDQMEQKLDSIRHL